MGLRCQDRKGVKRWRSKDPAAEPNAISDIPELLTPCETAKILRTTAGVLAVWRSERRLDLPYIKIGRSVSMPAAT